LSIASWGVVENFGFFMSQQVQALFLLFIKHFKPIFGEILVDGYLSGMGLSEKINHTLHLVAIIKQSRMTRKTLKSAARSTDI